MALHGCTVDFIQRRVRAYGIWEPDITQIFVESIASGDTVIDVGANWGYFTALAAGLTAPCGRVYAIEAVPSLHDKLRRSLQESGVRHVELFNIAAGASVGEIEIFRGAPDNVGNSSSRPYDGFTSEGLVPLRTLDDLIPVEQIGKVALVKIDTEGDEAQVLAGMRGLLKALRAGAKVLVEVSPEMLADRAGVPNDVLAFFPAEAWDAFVVANSYEPDAYMDRPLPPKEHRGPLDARSDMMFVKRRFAEH